MGGFVYPHSRGTGNVNLQLSFYLLENMPEERENRELKGEDLSCHHFNTHCILNKT